MSAPEILAPAGGKEQLLAAVRCGADAVYLGGKGFNARRGAENFGASDLRDAVEYCHARNVRVYVTFNTLAEDAEADAMHAELEEIAASGADAALVQDLAVASALRERVPDLALHASTQMAIHNAEGAREAADLGFRRVVLARELTLREIADVTARSPIATEVFVHGAHCMSVSGNCYLSAMIGGRSGNRGMCAQPCRLPFTARGREYALSLKDLSYITHLAELAAAGVSAFKIEGRLKRPEYVAAAVTACRDALEGRTPDLETLRAVFSRGGFTDGYLTGRRTMEMFGSRTREDAEASAPVLGKLAALYRAETPRVPVDLALALEPGAPARLSAGDGVRTASAEGPAPEPARTAPMTEDYARKCLGKTGGTPFFLRGFSASLAPGLTLPASALNAMRRDALQSLLEMRGATPPHPVLPRAEVPLPAHAAPDVPELRLRFEKAAQLPDALPEGCRVLLPARAILASPELAARFGPRLIAEAPALIFPEAMPETRLLLQRTRALGVEGLLCPNLGAVRLARELGFAAHGGAELNILNSRALEEYRRIGLADATLSFELSMAGVRAMAGTLPRGVLLYGFLPLMKLRACPARGRDGCGGCAGVASVTDRRGETFPVLCREKKFSELFNCVPLYAADKGPTRCDFVTLSFTTESPAQCAHVIELARRRAAPDFPRTAGLYFRELL